ncbi:MAG: tol-pal system protein YbgF [Burkholderiales bacterium]
MIKQVTQSEISRERLAQQRLLLPALLAFFVLVSTAGSVVAAVDQDARVQISRQQTQITQIQNQMQRLDDWRVSLQDENEALRQRYDGLHDVQRELNARFLSLRDQHSNMLSEWSALRSGHGNVEAQLSNMLVQVQNLAQSSERTEIRIAQVEGQVGGRGALQLMNQVDGLNAEINKLRGQVEVLANSIENAQKRQRDMYLDLDTRMRRLEQQDAAAMQKKSDEAIAALETRIKKLEETAEKLAAIPAPVTNTVPEQPAASVAGDPRRMYEAAMNAYRVADYQGAISLFEAIVRDHPQHTLASNAQYWIGDAYYQLRDYRSSIEAQKRLIELFPNSAKVPDAMLNIGSSELGLGEAASARRSWEELIARYPDSESAGKARDRLARLQ